MCDECNNIFTTPGELDSHIKVAHKAQSCKFCAKTCQSQPDLNYHLHKNHREDTCSTSIRVSPVLPPLSSRACSDSPLQLLRGDLKWYNATQCSHQITSCASPCLTCDSIFLNEDELHSRMNTVHVLNITNPCSNCNKPLPGYHNSSNHLVDDHVTCLHPVP